MKSLKILILLQKLIVGHEILVVVLELRRMLDDKLPESFKVGLLHNCKYYYKVLD
jgi:hypothetical protein